MESVESDRRVNFAAYKTLERTDSRCLAAEQKPVSPHSRARWMNPDVAVGLAPDVYSSNQTMLLQ